MADLAKGAAAAVGNKLLKSAAQRQAEADEKKRNEEEVADKAAVELLTKGAAFLKHGHSGKPHTKIVYLVESEHKLCWVDKRAADLQKVDGKMVDVSQITGVVSGKGTKLFQRPSAANANADCCFSVEHPVR